MAIAKEVFEILMETAEAERDKIFDHLMAGKARIQWVLLQTEHLRTHMPKPARPQFPGIKIDKALAKHPNLDNIDAILIPSSSSCKLLYQAEVRS